MEAKKYTKEQLETMTVKEVMEIANGLDVDLARRLDEAIEAITDALYLSPDTS